MPSEPNDPERKEAQTNRGVPRGGDMATEIVLHSSQSSLDESSINAF